MHWPIDWLRSRLVLSHVVSASLAILDQTITMASLDLDGLSGWLTTLFEHVAVSALGFARVTCTVIFRDCTRSLCTVESDGFTQSIGRFPLWLRYQILFGRISRLRSQVLLSRVSRLRFPAPCGRRMWLPFSIAVGHRHWVRSRRVVCRDI